MHKIKAGDKNIGEGRHVFIIAEAGVNHNGSVKLAKKLVDAAVNAKADAVKFQTFKAELVVTKDAKMASYQIKNLKKQMTQQEMIRKYELTEEDFAELKKYCDNKGIMFLSTPHSNEWSVDVLEKLKVPLYKIGSGDLTNLPFLDYVAKKQKPIVIGTGMSTMEEIKSAISAIKKTGNDKIVMLQAVTQYPTPYEDLNLRAMLSIKKECDVLVGLSDHTTGTIAPVAAVALGAVVIEKHFTLDKNMKGPDHSASLNPEELKVMVENIRNTELMLGSGIKKPTKQEIEIMKVVRKSLVSKVKIKKGAKITRDMIDIKRPATGIHPKDLEKVLGKKAKKDIEKDMVISFNDID